MGMKKKRQFHVSRGKLRMDAPPIILNIKARLYSNYRFTCCNFASFASSVFHLNKYINILLTIPRLTI